MRLTVGPLPPTVYWRRRLLVLAVVLLVVLLTAWACGGTGDGNGRHDAAGQPAGSPSNASVAPTHGPGRTGGAGTTGGGRTGGAGRSGSTGPRAHGGPAGSTATPTRTVSPSMPPRPTGPAPTCSDSDLVVSTATKPHRIPVGSYPTLSLTILNDSSHACTRDIGGHAQELIILQGKAHIWSSDDCGPRHDADDGKDVRRFGAGVGVTFFVVWDGKTSDKECSAPRKIPPRGDYQLVGRLGSKTGKPTTFTLV